MPTLSTGEELSSRLALVIALETWTVENLDGESVRGGSFGPNQGPFTLFFDLLLQYIHFLSNKFSRRTQRHMIVAAQRLGEEHKRRGR